MQKPGNHVLAVGTYRQATSVVTPDTSAPAASEHAAELQLRPLACLTHASSSAGCDASTDPLASRHSAPAAALASQELPVGSYSHRASVLWAVSTPLASVQEARCRSQNDSSTPAETAVSLILTESDTSTRQTPNEHSSRVLEGRKVSAFPHRKHRSLCQRIGIPNRVPRTQPHSHLPPRRLLGTRPALRP